MRIETQPEADKPRIPGDLTRQQQLELSCLELTTHTHTHAQRHGYECGNRGMEMLKDPNKVTQLPQLGQKPGSLL